LWRALVATGTLAQAGRVTVEPVTADRLGFVGGRDLRLGPLTTAVALFYVPRQPACATVSPADHPQQHQASQIRALIQVNMGDVRGTPEQIVAQLHSLIMHEYTHAEQAMERGMLPGMTFTPIGNREFFFEQQVAQPARGVLEMLDEIEAYASEIEQAERTGLADGPNLRTVICELWDKYLRYRDRTRQHPNPDVAARVRRAIEQGRTLYRQYVAASTGHLPPNLRAFALSLQNCPARYDPSLF
jgi:hypothetical protein